MQSNGAPVSPFTGVPGWDTDAEERMLMHYAQHIPEGSFIVEIGAEFGRSAAAFLTVAHPSIKVMSIDLFPGDLLYKYTENLREAGVFGDRAIPVQGDSKLLPVTPAFKCALLFIDGDHSYEGALADFERWTPSVQPGGYLCVHDCACSTNRTPHYLHYEVTRALNTWYTAQPGNWKLLDPTVDSLMVFQRLLDPVVIAVDALYEAQAKLDAAGGYKLIIQSNPLVIPPGVHNVPAGLRPEIGSSPVPAEPGDDQVKPAVDMARHRGDVADAVSLAFGIPKDILYPPVMP